MLKDFATSVVQTLREHGYEAYLVGGCVRDLLLDREPADYDVATSATPREVMRIFPRTYAVGEQFGVVLVPAPETESSADASPNAAHAGLIEVATFRADLGYSDGRHPDEVRFTKSAREDVQRRDFTINGLLLDPATGEVLDYVGGQADLKTGIIRAVGDPELRFDEDKLRMLRALRFAARFSYEIEPATFAAIRKLAQEVSQVSRERVRDELTKMLTEGHARQAFLLLDSTALLPEVLPEIGKMKGVEQPPEFHPEGDVFVHTLLALDSLPQPCPATLAWGTLLHDVGKPATFRRAPDRIRFDDHVHVGVKIAEGICQRLRFSNQDTGQILALVANHMRFGYVRQMKDSTFKRFIRLPHFEQHLALHRADVLASYGDPDLYEFTKERMASIPPAAIRPEALLSGDDLIAMGYAPGPKFKEILAAVEDEQLDGRIAGRDDAVLFVKRQFPLE
jgi:poly(A) polymerase